MLSDRKRSNEQIILLDIGADTGQTFTFLASIHLDVPMYYQAPLVTTIEDVEQGGFTSATGKTETKSVFVFQDTTEIHSI